MQKTDEVSAKIVDYWDSRVSKYGNTGQSSLLDDNQRALEVETAISWLAPSDRALDIFCANGASSIQLVKHCKSLVGIDLSEKMIESAQARLTNESADTSKLSFKHLDALSIFEEFGEGQFDAVTSIRGIINLPTWELQKECILAVHKLLPKGGKFIFLEGSRDGLEKLNDYRASAGLTPLTEPWFDRYFQTEELMKFMKPYFDVKDSRNLDMYFLSSRVVYPKLCAPEEPSFDNIANKVAKEMSQYATADTGTSLIICKCFTKK